MAPPPRSRPLRKDSFAFVFKQAKPTLYSEAALTTRGPPTLVPRIGAITWSPAGSLIATCTSASIRVWTADRPSVKNSTELRNAHPKEGGGGSGVVVEKVAFCPTAESLLASTGHDGMVRLWDIRTPSGVVAAGSKGIPLGSCRVGQEGHFLTWHPNGREMLVGRKDDVIHTVDVRRMTGMTPAETTFEMEAVERSPVKDRGYFYAMSFSNTGREVFATTHDGAVKILDYPSMSLLHTLSAHSSTTYTAQQSPTGGTLAIGSADSLISIWDTRSWVCTHTLTSQTTSVKDLSYSFDGVYLVAGSGSGSDAKEGSSGIEVYHVDTGEVVHTIETSNPITWAAWHPSRYMVAYAGDPGGLKIVGGGGLG